MAIVIGCDLHARFQQLAVLDTASGEIVPHRLEHDGEQVREFYRRFPPPVQVGVEATTGVYWLQELLHGLGHELVVGDAARLRAMVVRRQKTDARDAEHLALVLAQGRFPRVWLPGPELRDLRQLLLHRHRLVRMRTQLRNGLHALARNHGPNPRRRRFTQAARAHLAALPLGEFAQLRREESIALHDDLDSRITALDGRLQQQLEVSEQARRLATHPGVGPVTALAWTSIIGDISRFGSSAQLCSYLGLIPSERSTGGKQRLGSISKQGNSFLRFLLVEAAQTAVRGDDQLGRVYRRLAARRDRPTAKVAIARRLAVRLYWMSRRNVAYSDLREEQAHAG